MKRLMIKEDGKKEENDIQKRWLIMMVIIHYRVFDNSVQCDFSGLLPEPK
jgi:hypothetical protein